MKSWQLIFTDSYNPRAVRFLKRHPELQLTYCSEAHRAWVRMLAERLTGDGGCDAGSLSQAGMQPFKQNQHSRHIRMSYRDK